MDCIFCKINAGEMPSYKVYEDNHTLAFLDITQRVKGHTLVVPRVHAENMLDLNEQLYHDYFFGIKKTVERLEEILHPDGFNIGWNHGEAAGQAVPHIHCHIMPRWNDDGGSSMQWIAGAPSEVPAEEVAKLFL